MNKKKDRFTYGRKHGSREYVIDCNLGKETKNAWRPEDGYKLVFPDDLDRIQKLGAFEARIWKKVI